MSSNTAIADLPLRSVSFNPDTKASIAEEASSLNARENSSADILATCAKLSSDSPPFSVANCILTISLLNAVPPASALIPNELSVAANPNILSSVIPTCDPAAANLSDIVIISDSVVAVLLPNSTRVEPNLSTVSIPLPVMLRNLAKAVLASSLDMFVVSPSITAVLVNANKLSVPSTPN